MPCTVCTRCRCCWGKLWETNLLLWFYPIKFTSYIFLGFYLVHLTKLLRYGPKMDKWCTSLMDSGKFVAFTRYSYHLLGIIYFKMMTTLLFFYIYVNWPSMPHNFPSWRNSFFFKWDSVLTCKYQHLCVVCLYSTAITGVCYVRLVKTIWVAAGTEEAAMYDPKSGENVSVLYIK